MTIGVRFPDEPFDPVARVQAACDAAMTGYREGLDRRMRELFDAGIAAERISIVVRHHCPQCRGTGITTTIEDGDWKRIPSMDAKIAITISECPTCPGLCVDGKPTARMGMR